MFSCFLNTSQTKKILKKVKWVWWAFSSLETGKWENFHQFLWTINPEMYLKETCPQPMTTSKLTLFFAERSYQITKITAFETLIVELGY